MEAPEIYAQISDTITETTQAFDCFASLPLVPGVVAFTPEKETESEPVVMKDDGGLCLFSTRTPLADGPKTVLHR